MNKNTIKHVAAGLFLGGISAVCLTAGTEAAEAAAENTDGIMDALNAVATFLPFPWNVVVTSVAAIGSAIFVWKRKKKK